MILQVFIFGEHTRNVITYANAILLMADSVRKLKEFVNRVVKNNMIKRIK